ncbi:MAG: acyl transferase [Salinivirgaceae bacterium]|nr:acyl transferase [Salinivirgaceae bacterium]
MDNWVNKFLNISDDKQFNDLCIEAFLYQYHTIPVYQEYCKHLNIRPSEITHYTKIPFLPIEFFKTHDVKPENSNPEITFSSSGTTGTKTSKHHVADLAIYKASFLAAFKKFYGNVEEYCVLALLPSYLERTGSSLIYMAEELIKLSKHADSGFYLNNYQELSEKLKILSQSGKKILLLGVSYALLDMAEQFPMKLENTIIMETGGMKGRRKELVREELHERLCAAFGVSSIHSEYGMTELLSQGYSFGEGLFKTPPWMKILIRNTYDPFEYLPAGKSGGINVIDLANIHSCCFIETKDLGKTFTDDSFTILGRFDDSDIRGCNLMAE